MPLSNQLFDINLLTRILYIVVGAATHFLSLVALKTIKKYDLETPRITFRKGFKMDSYLAKPFGTFSVKVF